jgi:chitodextrinase
VSNSCCFASDRPLASIRGRWGIVLVALIATIGVSSCGSGNADAGASTSVVASGGGTPPSGGGGTPPAADTQAPTVPAGLAVTGFSSTLVSLSWSASTDNVGVAGYRVFRSGVQVGTSATTSFSDTGLSPSTTYSYTVSAVDAAGNSSAQSTPVSQTTASASVGAISASLAASRLSGVAPLYVFFDATGTTSANTTRPFSNLHYEWNFGDPGGSPVLGASWLYGTGYNDSRNSATGASVAHVFETPGTYTVTLNIYDPATGDSSLNNTVQITVSAWSGATNGRCLYVGNTLPVKGSGGVPNDAYTDVAQSSGFDSIINTTVGNGNTYKCMYFNRGDTFNVTNIARWYGAGPGIIGAYGSGAKPLINASSFNSTMLQVGDKDHPNVGDWRIMDLKFEGNGGSNVYAVKNDGAVDQLLILRDDAHNIHGGFEIEESVPGYYNSNGHPGHLPNDQDAIVDSTVSVVTPQNTLPTDGNNGGYSIYFASSKMGLMGNFWDNNWGGEHGCRTPRVTNGYIAHNTGQRSGLVSGGKHVFTLRAPGWTGYANIVPAGTYTEYVEVSDNHFIGSKSPWVSTTGPQNNTSDERVRRVIWERNWWTVEESTVQLALRIEASENTVRENIFDLSGAGGHSGVSVTYGNTAGLPVPDMTNIFNNTFYSGDTGSGFHAVTLASQVTNTAVQNNLAYAPNDSTHNFLSGSGTGLTASNNSSDAQVATNPLFTSTSPFNPGNAKPLAGSYAIGAGTSVPVWPDFFISPWSGSYDLGAVKH